MAARSTVARALIDGANRIPSEGPLSPSARDCRGLSASDSTSPEGLGKPSGHATNAHQRPTRRPARTRRNIRGRTEIFACRRAPARGVTSLAFAHVLKRHPPYAPMPASRCHRAPTYPPKHTFRVTFRLGRPREIAPAGRAQQIPHPSSLDQFTRYWNRLTSANAALESLARQATFLSTKGPSR